MLKPDIPKVRKTRERDYMFFQPINIIVHQTLVLPPREIFAILLVEVTSNTVIILQIMLGIVVGIALILALAGLSILLIMHLSERNRSQDVQPPTPLFPSLHNQNASSLHTFYEYEYQLVPSAWLLETPGKASIPTIKKMPFALLTRKLSKAVKRWQEKDNLDELISLTFIALTNYFTQWNQFLQELRKTLATFSSEQTQQIRQIALQAMRDLPKTDDVVIQENKCVTAIILNSILFNHQMDKDKRAGISFDTGLAFFYLAHTTVQLKKHFLIEAEKHYKHASATLSSNPSAISPLPYIKTLLALGDVKAVLARIKITESQSPHQDVQDGLFSYQKALESYKRNFSSPNEDPVYDEITERIKNLASLI
jgi:hypothetical protein